MTRERTFRALLAIGLVAGLVISAGCGMRTRQSEGMSPAEAARRITAALAESGDSRERITSRLAAARAARPWLADERLGRRADLAMLEWMDATADRERVAAMRRAEAAAREWVRGRNVDFEGRPTAIAALDRILDHDPAADRRRRAWFALAAVWDESAAALRDVFDARNRWAKSAGYQGELDRVERHEELPEIIVRELLVAIRRATSSRADELGGRVPWSLPMQPPSLFPMLAERLTQEDAMRATRRLVVGMGFDRELVRVLLESESERVRAARFAESGSLEGLLGRIGRALYREALPTEPAEFARVASRATERAVSLFFSAFASDEEWLRAEFPVLMQDLSPLPSHREHAMLECRVLAARIEFEAEAYRNPGRDLDLLWQDLLEKWVDARRFDGVASWARDRSLARESFRLRDELLGRVIAAQLRNYCIASHGDIVDEPRTRELLEREIFELGAARPWSDIVESATAEPLRPGYYLREIVDGATRTTIREQLRRSERRERFRYERGSGRSTDRDEKRERRDG